MTTKQSGWGRVFEPPDPPSSAENTPASLHRFTESMTMGYRTWRRLWSRLLLCGARRKSMVNELFDICCERDPQPADQRTRLITALKRGADIHATDKNGVTALHHAVRFRSPTAVKTLIEHGANVNRACRRNGSTPLHRAVTQTGAPGTAGRNHAARQIVEILLAAGADPSIANKSGKKPVQYVTDETIKSLLKKQ